jgi:hypothetical protein
MSQWISGASLWYRDKDKVTGNVVATDQANVGSFWIRRDDGSKITAVRQGGQNAVPFDYDDIVAQLRQGRPVMLAVPTLGGDNPEGAKGVRHYIVAFGLDMSAPSTGPVDPSQIFISDPGYGSGTYKNVDGTGFDDTAIAPVRNLTLAQYFSVLNSGSKLKNGAPSRAGTICQDWLDSGRYYDNGTLKTLSSDLRPTLITEFAVGAGAANSAITVHSPVEVVITDRTTGQRYASSSDVALPGDIVLARTGEDLADDVTATDPILTTDPFPAYSLMLPNALYGKSLDLSIIGTGSGSYTVDYQSGSDQVQASAPLTGFINDGDTITGQFDVTVTPEPSTLLLLALGATGLLNKRAKRREIGRRQMP